MSLLSIRLKRIPNVLGIYGPSKDQFPARMSMLHPSAAAAFDAVAALTGKPLRVSDMYRTPAESLKAMQTKRGVQPPGYSAHNFGLAIDIDTDAMLKVLGVSKAVLDVTMQSRGWYCHRRDSRRGMEDWHYNYLGEGDEAARWLAKASATSTSGAIEAKIMALYGAAFDSDERVTQARLKALGHYAGEVDGAFGPRSQAALKAFQATVQLPQTGVRDVKTLRTLAVASASLDVAESTASV